MRTQAASSVSRSMLLVFASISAIGVVADAGCGEGPAGSPTPAAAVVQPAETPAPSRPAVAPTAVVTPTVADTPVPTQAAAKPVATVAADATATVAADGVRPLPRPVVPGVDLHDTQVVTAPGRMRSNMAPWRDGGGNSLFSTHVFGTPFLLNEESEVRPWIAVGITSNEDFTVWTMKLRKDAVFQDGTPITAADFKAYWEHGAKPENIVAWGGASLTIGEIRGWKELRAGDVTEAPGLRVVDDQTLEIETHRPSSAWPLYMAAWHVGISKLEQVLADESWGTAPIGAGPFSLTYDPDSGLTELTRVDLVGKHWSGPRHSHDSIGGISTGIIIEKLVLPNIPDEQQRLLMFESGELDVMMIDRETYEAALDPGHPFNPLLYVSPYGGLWYIKTKIDMAPLEDLLVRRALAHGQDMESIVPAIWGPTATHAKGLISSQMSCHDPYADYQPYDPDLARQNLSESTYADDLPLLMIDLSRSDTVAMGVAIREYWKDNLGVELDVLKRESGVPRRESSQLYRFRMGSRLPDPTQIVGLLARSDSIQVHYPPLVTPWDVLKALAEQARSLPLDRPDRCAVIQTSEEKYLDKVYIIPIREVDPVRWVVQPWLRGFESSFNQDFNTLTTAYVVRH